MSSYSLADIQAAADKQFGDVVIELPEGETATFRNAVRLPKEKRQGIVNLFRQGAIVARVQEGEETLDVYDLHREALTLAAKTPGDYERLEAVLGDDAGQWLQVFNLYNGATELGEASTSES